jgi:chemotaxis protein methyltransferase CheR
VNVAVPELKSWEFVRLRDLVYGEAGIWLSGGKIALVASRLQKRLRELGVESWAAYHRLVVGDAGERQRMLECLCTHETSFFREPRQWEVLEQRVYPAWRAAGDQGRRAKRLRAWSAGCSTGEEPFSIAMSLLRHFPGWEVDVLATDLSERALSIARAAEWPLARSEQLPPSYRTDFMLRGFGTAEGRMRAQPHVQKVIRFEQLNLNDLGERQNGPFDLVFCRNVLIYFDAASKDRVLRGLVRRLVPGGILLLGHAEAFTSMREGLRPVVPTVYLASP